MKPTIIDLETESIEAHPRPGSPPPAGTAIKFPGKAPLYLAHGHPTGNGAWTLDRKGKVVKAKGYDDPKRASILMLKDAFKGEILGHNIAKFDLPVIEDHYGLKPPAWDKVHDTLFSLFLRDPHSSSLSLKPAAEHWLGEKPEERDAVYDWLAEHEVIAKPRKQKGVLKYQKDAGAFISKAPGDIVALYAIGDLTRTEGLHEMHLPWVIKKKMQAAYDRERELAPILLENEREGIRVDMDALERDLPWCEKALKASEEWIRKRLKIKDKDYWSEKHNDHVFNFDSDAHVAQALLKARVVKDFPKTPSGQDSVSKKNLTIDFFGDPQLYHALHYRNSMVTVLTQSLRKWYAEGAKKNGRIYREWNQVRQGHGDDNATKGARSGRITVSGFANIAKRFGAKDPSYQHPKFMDVPEPPLARAYILPDKGDLFGHSDFDQQEMKITAHYEEGALAEAYKADPKTDIHVKVYEWIKETSGKDYPRDTVKMADFLISYGGGAPSLAERLRIPQSEAKEIMKHWRAALPDVVDFDKFLKGKFKRGEYIRTLGGRVYFCKPPTVAKKGPRKGQMITFEYTALNYLIQPSAADQTKQAIINFHKHPKRDSRLLVTVYDEINTSVPKGAAIRQLLVLRECMVNAFKLDVPVTTTLKLGESWAKAEKLKEEELTINRKKVA